MSPSFFFMSETATCRFAAERDGKTVVRALFGPADC